MWNRTPALTPETACAIVDTTEQQGWDPAQCSISAHPGAGCHRGVSSQPCSEATPPLPSRARR